MLSLKWTKENPKSPTKSHKITGGGAQKFICPMSHCKWPNVIVKLRPRCHRSHPWPNHRILIVSQYCNFIWRHFSHLSQHLLAKLSAYRVHQICQTWAGTTYKESQRSQNVLQSESHTPHGVDLNSMGNWESSPSNPRLQLLLNELGYGS